MSADRDSKVIGYYALASVKELVCNENACVVAGSEASMREFIAMYDPGVDRGYTIHKLRFGVIVAGLKEGGAAFAFEEASYARFRPLAAEIGLPAIEADFAAAHARGDRFLTFRLLRAEPDDSGLEPLAVVRPPEGGTPNPAH